MAVSAVVGAVAIAGTAYSQVQSASARSDERKANKRAARIEAVKAQRERVQAQRQNRIQTAQLFAQGAAAGVSDSSGVQGAAGALTSSTNANISTANQIDALNRKRLGHIADAQEATGRAEIGSAVSNLGFKILGG